MMDVIRIRADDGNIRQHEGALPISDKKLRLRKELAKRRGGVRVGPSQDTLCRVAAGNKPQARLQRVGRLRGATDIDE